MLRIDVITIFPELFEPFGRTGVLGGACERQKEGEKHTAYCRPPRIGVVGSIVSQTTAPSA